MAKKYGGPRRTLKFPVTIEVLRKIFPCLPGWPDMRRMCHNDRVFAAASAVGVFGFLRGGEFLWSRGSSRPLLRYEDISIKLVGDVRVVEISIRHPKARWWLRAENALCLSPSSSSLVDPVWLLDSLWRLRSPAGPKAPAFSMEDGSPLAKSWMLRRTRELLEEAGVRFPDHLGARVDVAAASWRAGGACSAKRAGVSDATICHMGRWASNAFLRYTSAVEFEELKNAVARMAVPQGEGALLARVGNALPAEDVEDVPRLVDATLQHLRSGARRTGGVPGVPPPRFARAGARRANG